MNAYCEKSHKAQSSRSIVAAALDSTVDAVTAVGKLTVDAATATAVAVGQFFLPLSSTNSNEKQMPKYNIKLDLYLQNSVVKKLNQEQKLFICAAAASLPSGGPNDNRNNKKKILIDLLINTTLATYGVEINFDAIALFLSDGLKDNENNIKIFIAFLASALLATSGVAIVLYTGSPGLLPTLLLETGSSGINHCIKKIGSNEKFLWKEWSTDMLKTGAEVLVLGALNKLRQTVPFAIRGSVNRDIIDALCSVYDIIEPYSNVIISIVKGDDSEEIVFEAKKSIDKQFGTSFSGMTVFEIESDNDSSRQNIDRYSGSYATVERVVNNIAFKIYNDRSISIDINN